jgi:hypothetical protein
MQRGKIRPTTRQEAVARAFQMVCYLGHPPGSPDKTLHPIGYRLEPGFNGGDNPFAEMCGSPSFGDRTYTADCIGMVLWALGIDRMQPGFSGYAGEWLNCPSILRDADHGSVYFEPVDIAAALPGDALVTDEHIGLIVRAATEEQSPLVIDCSPRHGWKTGVNTGEPWAPDCRAVRYKRFV